MAVCYFAETKIFKLNKKKSGKKKSSEIKKKRIKKNWNYATDNKCNKIGKKK